MQSKINIIPSDLLIHNWLDPNRHIEAKRIVLLAEDDIDDQEMLIDACHDLDPDLEFAVANTGSKAFDMLKNFGAENNVCLIILDYNLPEISGAEILERLSQSKLFPDVPKMVWSTSNSPVYQKRCMEHGAMNYLVKPNGVAGIRSIAKQVVRLCAQG